MKKALLKIAALGFVAFTATQAQAASYPTSIAQAVPQYPQSTIMMSVETPDGTHAMMTTSDPQDKIVAFYQSALEGKGWKNEMKTEMQNMRVLAYSKGMDRLSVTIGAGETPNESSISVALAKDEE